MIDDSELTSCIVKDCENRGVYFARRKAVGPFCLRHCTIFIRLTPEQRDLIEVHQALGDPIDNKFANWDHSAQADKSAHHRIKLENVRIK